MSGSAEGMGMCRLAAKPHLISAHEGRRQNSCFGPRLPRTWGAWPCVELVVRCQQAKAWLGVEGRESKWFWFKSEQAPSL